MTTILVLYYSETGHTETMARQIARGVESVDSASAQLRTVTPVSADTEATAPMVPANGPPYASQQDLAQADGLIIGSPAYYGTMAAALKYFLDQSGPLWLSNKLCGKPAGVFASAGSYHGGHESTLLNMMIPLLHHGMLICGLPYSEPALHATTSGGAPYGPTHVSGNNGELSLTDDEKKLCQALGARVADLAVLTSGS